MWRGSPAGLQCLMAFLTLVAILSAVSCGGEEEGAASAVVEVKSAVPSGAVLAEKAEVGKSLQSEGWVVTLVEQPELTKQLGSGTAVETTDFGDEGFGWEGIRTAEGMWLILTVQVTNDTGDLAMLPKPLLKVADAEGGEYGRAGHTVHAPLISADERWERLENSLAQWVFETNLPREGPLVFDVPEEATGLKLVMEGADDTIDLGF